MKTVITPAYTFTPGASGSGTIDLSSFNGFQLERLFAIINVTQNTIIYNVVNPSFGVTDYVNGVLTLACDTSGCTSNDLLQIIYDDPNPLAVEDESLIDFSGLFVWDGDKLKIKTELDQPLTDTQLRTVPVDTNITNNSIVVTGDFYPATQPVSLTTLPTLPAGSNTIGSIANTQFDVAQLGGWEVTANAGTNLNTSALALETGGNLSDINNKLPSGLTLIGDRLKVDADVSLPTSYPVTGTIAFSNTAIGVNNYSDLATLLASTRLQVDVKNNVSTIGDVTLDKSGLATDTNQATTNTTLSTINGKIPSNLTVTSTRLLVDGSGVTQPVSPNITRGSGIVDANTQRVTLAADGPGVAALNNIDTKTPTVGQKISANSSPVVLASDQSAIPVTLSNGANTIGSIANATFGATQSGSWTVGISGTPTVNIGTAPTIPISAASLPLPLDAAKESTLNSVDTKLPSGLTVASTRLLVDGSGVTQPISGTVIADTGLLQPLTDSQLRASAVDTNITNTSIAVTGNFYQAVQPVSLSTLPSLPAGTNSIGSITNTIFASTQSGVWDVSVNNFPSTVEIANEIGNPIPVSGSIVADTGLDQPLTDAQLRAANIGVTVSNPTDVSELATASNQITGNTSLSNINSKLPTNLTVTNARLMVDGSAVTQPVSGTVTADTGLLQPLTDNQLRASAVPVSGTFWQSTQPVSLTSLPALAAGSNTIGSIANTSFASTQSGTWNINNVSGTITLPTGAATAAKQPSLGTAGAASSDVLTVQGISSMVPLKVDGSGVTQPISGTVTADTGLAQPLTDTQLRASAVPVGLPENLITLFSRLRVANEETQISFRQDTPLRNLLITEGQTSGSNTAAVFVQADASTIMTVQSQLGARRFRSRTAGLYTAGNGLLCFFTFNFEGPGSAGVVKRVGYYDDNDGVFLEMNAGTLSWVLRSSVVGSTPEIRVNQNNWSNDNFDGTGAGYAFLSSGCHIMWISLEWLGVGDVYCGFVYNGVPIVAHVFRNVNIVQKPYMRTANLFLNSEISRTVLGGTQDNLRIICATLKTEGSLNKTGVPQIITLGASRATANANTLYPLITFRLSSGWLNSRVLISSFDAVINDNANTTCQFLLVKNPVIAGYTFVGTAIPNSSIEYQNNITTPIIGTALTISSYEQLLVNKTVNIVANTFVEGKADSSSINYMGSAFNNTADIYCLAMTSSTASNTVPSATINLWEQL